MKNFVILLVVLASALPAQARIMKFWSYQELYDRSDVVAIGTPVSTEDTSERASVAGISPEIRVIGVSTEFSISLVLKGDKSGKTLTLHHYRRDPLPPNTQEIGAPNLATFDLKSNFRYLLFLHRESDGRYSPISGQTDPALFSVVRLHGDAQ